jgi:hypothetical protein
MRKTMTEAVLEYIKPQMTPLDGVDGRLYTGVTVEYIHRYVLKGKFTKNGLINKLIQLHRQGKVRSLRCGDVQDIVFHNIEGRINYDAQNKNRYDGAHYQTYQYGYFLQELRKKKIKNE